MLQRIRDVLSHLRGHQRCDLAHNKAVRHIHHGAHTAYLGWYVIDWHMPVSPFCAVLLVFALASWAFNWHPPE